MQNLCTIKVNVELGVPQYSLRCAKLFLIPQLQRGRCTEYVQPVGRELPRQKPGLDQKYISCTEKSPYYVNLLVAT
jgi:hypothetical protein